MPTCSRDTDAGRARIERAVSSLDGSRVPSMALSARAMLLVRHKALLHRRTTHRRSASNHCGSRIPGPPRPYMDSAAAVGLDIPDPRGVPVASKRHERVRSDCEPPTPARSVHAQIIATRWDLVREVSACPALVEPPNQERVRAIGPRIGDGCAFRRRCDGDSCDRCDSWAGRSPVCRRCRKCRGH